MGFSRRCLIIIAFFMIPLSTFNNCCFADFVDNTTLTQQPDNSTTWGTVFRLNNFELHGKSSNTKALRRAWRRSCATEGSVTLVVPNDIVLKPIKFRGPCRSSSITVRFHGTVKASTRMSDYHHDYWILFDGVRGLTVRGGGILNGKGRIWWRNSCDRKRSRRCLRNAPTALKFQNCEDLAVKYLTVKNSPKKQVSFEECRNVVAKNLKVLAPGNSPNTDGIHTLRSQNITISDSRVATGDDCISIATGSSVIRAYDITCGPGHGISIGSLGRGDSEGHVSDVIIDGAKLKRTTNGLRIKTWKGGWGDVSNIKFMNVKFTSVENPILIDQNECHDQPGCSRKKSALQVKDVLYQNIRGTSASDIAVNFDCSEFYKCQGIRLQDIQIWLDDRHHHYYDEAQASCRNVQLSEVSGIVTPICLNVPIPPALPPPTPPTPTPTPPPPPTPVPPAPTPVPTPMPPEPIPVPPPSPTPVPPAPTPPTPPEPIPVPPPTPTPSPSQPPIPIPPPPTPTPIPTPPEPTPVPPPAPAPSPPPTLEPTPAPPPTPNPSPPPAATPVPSPPPTPEPTPGPPPAPTPVPPPAPTPSPPPPPTTEPTPVPPPAPTTSPPPTLTPVPSPPTATPVPPPAPTPSPPPPPTPVLPPPVPTPVLPPSPPFDPAPEPISDPTPTPVPVPPPAPKPAPMPPPLSPLPTPTPPSGPRFFNVEAFGAKGDGNADDTEAFNKAWKEVCASDVEAFLIVPDKQYVVRPIIFGGPCKSPITVQIIGYIKAFNDPAAYKNGRWLWFQQLIDIRVQGGGIVDGSSDTWSCDNPPCRKAPRAVGFYYCEYVTLRNLRIRNAVQTHVVFIHCSSVSANYVIISSPPGTNPNSHGFHLSNTKQAEITDTVIGTGEDCISILSETENVRVNNVTCGPGHGIRIGGLGRNSRVSDVTVENSKFNGSQYGLRIQTLQGGSGYARNINYRNIEMDNVRNPIVIDQNFCPHKYCSKQANAVQVSNVRYENIRGTSSKDVAIKFDCSDGHKCEGIVMKDIKMSNNRGQDVKAFCNNVNFYNTTNVTPLCP